MQSRLAAERLETRAQLRYGGVVDDTAFARYPSGNAAIELADLNAADGATDCRSRGGQGHRWNSYVGNLVAIRYFDFWRLRTRGRSRYVDERMKHLHFLSELHDAVFRRSDQAAEQIAQASHCLLRAHRITLDERADGVDPG